LGQQVSSFTIKAVDGKAKETIALSPKIAAGSYYLGIYDEGKGAVLQFIKE
jgi:hypothetical protein